MIDREKYEISRDLTYQYVQTRLLFLNNNLSDDVMGHVVSMGVSVLETKFPEIGPGYGGGGFVQALVDNDLMGTFARADNVNAQYIKFYCTLLYNFSPYHLEYPQLKETV